MEVRVLGPIEVARQGRRTPLTSRRQRTLLAALAVHAGELVTVDCLIDILWGSEPPASARASLHSYVSRLRRTLGDGDGDEHGPLITAGSGYLLDLDAAALDAAGFERLARQAHDQLERDPSAAREASEAALALWRGPAFDDLADQPFAQAEAARLEELRLATREQRAEACLRLGRHAEVVADLEALVAEQPLRERCRGQLMVALARCGRQADALDVYRDHRRRLADELGLDPSPALQQLEQDILQQTAAVTAVPGTTPDDRHRRAGNLPVPVTSFVGRDEAVSEVAALLDSARIVTLTGVGGVGKTRLAEHVARQVADRYPDGAWLVDLAPVDHAAVAHTVAAVLDVHHQGGGSALADRIVSVLRDRRLLLVLDNCEHVLPTAAELVAAVVSHCPHVAVLATSRERLAVPGEHLWPVPPLAAPARTATGRELARVPSVRLFCDRAASVDATFRLDDDPEAVADICARLDGVPLAIELAAARVAALRPRDLAERLAERFELLAAGPHGGGGRHRTLQAAVQWSYELLTPEQRSLFDRLSVFAGGLDVEAAEEVCGDDALGAPDVVGGLAELVDRSMLVADRSGAGSRFRLLEPLRQFAAARLDEQQRDRLGRAHARYFVTVAERADRQLRGPDEAAAVAAITRDLDNLRAAHRWALAAGDVDLALRLPAALFVFALHRLRDEVFTWAEAAAELADGSGHPLCPVVYGVAAHGVTNRGDLVRSRALAERALALTGSPDHATVPALMSLAVCALFEGRLDDCAAHAAEAATLAAEAGRPYDELHARLHLPLAAAYSGRTDDALQLAEDFGRRADALDNPTVRSWGLYLIGECLMGRDPEQAAELLEEAQAVAGTVDNRLARGVALVSATSLRARSDRPREALRAFHDAIVHWRDVGDRLHQRTTLRNLVPLLARLGADEAAAVLLAACRWSPWAGPVFGRDADRLDDLETVLRSRLGGRFDAALSRGRTMSADDCVAFALDRITSTR